MAPYGPFFIYLPKTDFSSIFHVDRVEEVPYGQNGTFEQSFASSSPRAQEKSLPVNRGQLSMTIGFSLILSHIQGLAAVHEQFCLAAQPVEVDGTRDNDPFSRIEKGVDLLHIILLHANTMFIAIPAGEAT